MRAAPWSIAGLAAVVVVTVGMFGWQHRTTAGLRDALARQRTLARERAQLEAENRRLVAAQPTAEQLADLLAKRMTGEQLRAQLAALRRREEESARAGAAAANAQPGVPSLKGTSVGFRLWQNAGQATPDAAFQTTLWASAAGDIDALTDLLVFDAEAKSQAAATFDRLPAAMQNELGTPERMIALLTALDVPLGRASILGQVSTPTGTNVSAQLVDASGKTKVAVFSLQADGDRWRLLVPAEVVKKYDGWLRAPATAGKAVQ